MNRPRPPRRAAAFTLVELLVVIAIIVVLIAVVTPAATHIQSSARLSSTGQLLVGQFDLARTTAIARNRVVEVRFYKLPGSLNPAQMDFHAVQLWVRGENGTSATAAPLGAMQVFPEPMILESAVSDFAPLLQNPAPTVQGATLLSAYGAVARSYVGFAYRTDGSTDLPLPAANADTWFCLAHDARDRAAGGRPPKNYYAVQVDPLTGRTTEFRP